MKEIEIVFTKMFGRRLNKNSSEKHTAVIVVPKTGTQGEVIDKYKSKNFGRDADIWVITRSLILK